MNWNQQLKLYSEICNNFQGDVLIDGYEVLGLLTKKTHVYYVYTDVTKYKEYIELAKRELLYPNTVKAEDAC